MRFCYGIRYCVLWYDIDFLLNVGNNFLCDFKMEFSDIFEASCAVALDEGLRGFDNFGAAAQGNIALGGLGCLLHPLDKAGTS